MTRLLEDTPTDGTSGYGSGTCTAVALPLGGQATYYLTKTATTGRGPGDSPQVRVTMDDAFVHIEFWWVQ